MKISLKLRASCTFLLLICLHCLWAQEITNYGVKSLSQKDGLLSGQVTHILKDNKGFIWIGTDNGLNIYDGKGIDQLCFLDSCDALARDRIKDIHETERGYLIIASDLGAFIISEDRSSITKIDLQGEVYKAFAVISEENRAYIGVDDAVYEVNLSDLTGQKTKLPLPIIQNLTDLIIKGDDLWIGTWGNGLFVYNMLSKEFVEFNDAYKEKLKGDSIKNVSVFANGVTDDIWIGDYENGLFHIDKDYFIEKYVHDDTDPNTINSNLIKTLTVGPKGYLWIGLEESGLDKFGLGAGTFKHYYADFQNKSIYEGYSIYSCFIDDQNQMWLGFRNDGLKIIPLVPSIFQHESFSNSERLDNVVVGLGASQNRIFIGTKGGLVVRKDDGSNEFYGLPNQQSPLAVYPINDNEVYVGTILGAIYKFEYLSKKFEKVLDKDQERTFQNEKINNFHLINDNTLLIGSKQGTYKFDILEKTLSKIQDTWTHTFSKLDNESLLLANFGKIQYRYFHETGKIEAFPAQVERNVKAAIVVNNDLYIGSDLGFFRLNTSTGELKQYKTIYPLINNQINALVKDSKNRIWASSQHNIFCFDPVNELFRVFSQADGMEANRFRDEMGVKTYSGRIVFGGNSGLTFIDPSKFEFTMSPKNLEFTTILIDNKKNTIAKLMTYEKEPPRLVLSHTQNTLTASFSLLNYINPDHHSYQYKLDESNGWQNLGPKNSVTLVDLNSGIHKLMVRAANENGVWSEEKELLIEITPPLFLSGYFIILYFVLGVLIILIIFRFRSKQLRLEKDFEIEHLKAENIREKSEREAEFHNMRLMFFTNISHEIRTPLTLILSPLEKFIQKGTAPTIEHLRLMYRNAERLRRLISQILDFRKMEAGQLKFEPSVGDIIKYTKECAELFNQLAQQKNIEYTIHCDADHLLVNFDRDKYEKIIINLISNAFKYTDKGSISLKLVHEKLSEESVKVSIEVKDTGSGIETEHLNYIFDRYYHVKTKLSNSSGTGIGLSLVKELIELHKGEISVSSTLNEGATFYVTLILHTSQTISSDDDESEQRLLGLAHYLSPENESEIEEENENQLPTLLIVEDNQDLRKYIFQEFSNSYHVIEASDGEVGLKLALKNIPDVVISDISMPNMDGLELAEKMKTDERTSHIPIILLTAHGSHIHQTKGFELGAEDFIVKPFSSEILKIRVNNLLNSRKDLQNKFRKEFKVEPHGLPTSSMDQVFLTKAMTIVEDNLNNSEFNANDFASEMCMSRVHLYRKLKALTNESVSGFVKMIRLKLAADLIKDNKMSIKEAAYTVGFSDPKYFSKCFKQQFGIKPSEFSENPMENNEA